MILRYDNTTRIVTTFDGLVEISSRPYTEEENAAADAVAVQDQEVANEAEIGNKIETVDMPAMQAILNQTNADLRTDPSQEIKDIAKAIRRLDRKVQKLLDGTE